MKDNKKGLVPRLRFPEFRDAEEWNDDLVKDLVTTVTPPKKLTSDQYEHEGMFPVVDQSQEYICGWTNDEHALVPVESPLIVFGDHTCALKIVDQPFVQGADGIKILKSKNVIEPVFLYQYLLFSPVKMESYKRHFSTLKEKLVVYPEKKTGEQQKIADCLSSLDALIAAQADKIDALKTHKKGLMQQLFPREGETVPRLRFPEFRDAGPWEIKELADALTYEQPGPFIVTTEQYGTSGIPVLTAGKTFILGYTSETHGVYEQVPVIIFDDFTTDSKYVDFPFKIKSSAIKILSAKTGYSLKFVYEAMTMIRFDAAQHKRHWIGEFQYMVVSFPSLEEQQKIADCLSSLDALIAAHTEKLEALKIHKKGLMQQLFPSPEAITP